VNHLQDAVESVLRQTYPTHQIVIAISSGDNCLKDKSEVYNLFQTSTRFKNLYDKIRSISFPANNSNNTSKQDQAQLLAAPVPEIKVVLDPGCQVEQELNCGGPIARARNTAVKAASLYTTHYAMIDDDDVWLPNKNQIQLEEMDKQGFHMSASDAFYSPLRNIRCMDLPNNTNIAQMNFSDTSRFQRWNTGKYRDIIFKKLGLHPRASDDDLRNATLKMLQKHNILVQSSVLIEKSVFQMFNESSIFHRTKMEDYELFLRILRSPGNVSGILFFPEPLVFYEPSKRQSTCYKY
jgi:glycosyltransferase involved in cell wall biosynthesis